jgi:adenosylcobinamide-GDP ribazoletransferase
MGAVRVLADLVLPVEPATVLALLAAVLVTGGFHEDGLADASDGMGAHVSRERRLEIFKDSRVGTYGALAASSWCCSPTPVLVPLDAEEFVRAALAGHVLGRWSTLPQSLLLPPAAGQGSGGLVRASAPVVVGGTVFAAAVALLAGGLVAGAVALAVAVGLTGLGGSYFRARLGGVTGDTFGAVNKVVELGTVRGARRRLGGLGPGGGGGRRREHASQPERQDGGERGDGKATEQRGGVARGEARAGDHGQQREGARRRREDGAAGGGHPQRALRPPGEPGRVASRRPPRSRRLQRRRGKQRPARGHQEAPTMSDGRCRARTRIAKAVAHREGGREEGGQSAHGGRGDEHAAERERHRRRGVPARPRLEEELAPVRPVPGGVEQRLEELCGRRRAGEHQGDGRADARPA